MKLWFVNYGWLSRQTTSKEMRLSFNCYQPGHNRIFNNAKILQLEAFIIHDLIMQRLDSDTVCIAINYTCISITLMVVIIFFNLFFIS